MSECACEPNCCCDTVATAVLACSGGSNVGQLTNEAAKQIDSSGQGRFVCLAGIGGHVDGMIASVAGCDRVLVVDGCPLACGRKAMEKAGLSSFNHVVVTDLGIRKAHDFDFSERELNVVLEACRTALNSVCNAEDRK